VEEASIYRKGGGGSPLGWAPSGTHLMEEGLIKGGPLLGQESDGMDEG
jgi:hypothetical protein